MPRKNFAVPRHAAAVIALGVLAAGPAAAAVASAGAGGFVLHHEITFPGTPAQAWTRLVAPAAWWSSEHTYSGDAKNLSLAAVQGGCWCESLPGGGFVRHMDVLYVAPGRALRLFGAAPDTRSAEHARAVNADGARAVRARAAVIGHRDGD